MAWVVVGNADWVPKAQNALAAQPDGASVCVTECGHSLVWPPGSTRRGAIVCCECYAYNGDERWFKALTGATRVIAVTALGTSSMRVALRLAAQYPACDVLLRDSHGEASETLLHRATRLWRRASASAHLLATLPGVGAAGRPTTVAAVILAAQVTANVSRTAAMLGVSEVTLRAHLAAAGWPLPHVALNWCNTLHALWDFTEEGISLSTQECSTSSRRNRGEALAKRIRQATGRSAKAWQRDGGYRVAAEHFRNLLVAGDFCSGGRFSPCPN